MEKKFYQILSNYQKKIDREVKKFFDKKINQTRQIFLKETLKLLKEFSLRPAKRIRAILVNYGYFLAGGKDKKAILETSIFFELIHNYLLIHDDIIDQDEFRRGKKTIHYQYQKLFSLNKKEKEHFGQSMAIVTGDITNSLGYEILNSSNFPNDFKIRAIEKLNQIIYFTCYGQMFELWLREKMKFNRKITENEILEIYRNKTAFYTFLGPLQIGAILAGANQKFLEKIEKFALPLGIAFQIRDDIQEVFSLAKEIGKPIASDIREGQPNLLIFRALRQGKNLKKYLGREKINKNEIKKIREVLVESGSLQYCQDLAKKLIKKAKKILNSERVFPKKEKQFLSNLADFIITRKS